MTDDLCPCDPDIVELADRLDDIDTQLERIKQLLAHTTEGDHP